MASLHKAAEGTGLSGAAEVRIATTTLRIGIEAAQHDEEPV
jgi:hypothetical protein